MVGKQEESLVKTTPGLFSQALVMKGLNEPQQFLTGKFRPLSPYKQDIEQPLMEQD